MLTTLLLLAFLPGAEDRKPDPSKDDPPAKKELFAAEDWYKGQEGKEQEFVGVLEKSKNAGRIGFGRNNPYRLVMKGDVREVYIGGKPQILAEYVGKTIKLTGKAVEIGVEGKRHREIWPARLEVMAGPRKDGFRFQEVPADPALKAFLAGARPLVFVVDEDKTKEKEMKVQARGFWRASSRPGGAAQQLVIRSAAEAAKASGVPADGKGQELASQRLAQVFKVEKIDWDKQMVVVATAGAKPTGGYRVEVVSVAVKDGAVQVKWKLHSPKPGSIVTQAFTHPGEAVLVEKAEGKVVFDPPAPKGGDEEK